METNGTDEKVKTPLNKSNVEGRVSTKYIVQQFFIGSYDDVSEHDDLPDAQKAAGIERARLHRATRIIKRTEEEC